jgi:hypothetical protein
MHPSFTHLSSYNSTIDGESYSRREFFKPERYMSRFSLVCSQLVRPTLIVSLLFVYYVNAAFGRGPVQWHPSSSSFWLSA